MKTIQIIISGKVQGVWYRNSTKEKADEIGVLGTVENLVTGQVKIIAQGDKMDLEALAAWAKEGPKYAEVLTIETTIVLEPLQYDDFIIIR